MKVSAQEERLLLWAIHSITTSIEGTTLLRSAEYNDKVSGFNTLKLFLE